jgi:uncharacterized repeat protein (TIGR01451 family)
MLKRRRSSLVPLFGLVASASLAALAGDVFAADPILRHQEDLRGDVAVFGNTLAYDCGAGIAAPAGAFASCAAEANTADTAPDVYWRDEIADATVAPTEARTSATLVLPAGAKVTYARLYWGALTSGAAQDPDLDVVLDWLGGPQQTILADASWVVPYGLAAHPDWYYYQASGDATQFVAEWGAGDFRVTDVTALPLAGQGFDIDRAFSAWTLVVFYESPEDDLRNLALFDGLTSIDPGQGAGSASVNLSGFLVPPGFQAKMAAFTYEGDAIYNGDHFTMNGAQVTNAMNPADNFFNSSRTFLGAGVSGASDVPKFTGAPGEMAGYDLDTIDVTAQLAAGDTTCDVGADSSYDIFLLGGFVTSVTNLAPYFQPTKVVEDLNGLPTVEGDVLEYTIAATNTGNDDAIDVVLTDVIESGLKFVPGSISIEKGGALGSKTDASGDDQGEYSSGSKTVTVRVGAGADKQDGGTIGVGEEFEVRFRVTVAAIDGQVSNQGSLSASGASGAGEKTYLTDGDPSTVVADPTTIDVGQCASDADCPLEKPHCDVNLGICQPCATDADCSDPAKPACQPDGTCGECSATNASLCVDQKPVCDANQGNCVFCIPGADGDASICVDSSDGPECVPGPNDTTHCGCFEDSNCGDLKSGRVCEGVNELCINGCRGIGGNGCPDGFVCTSEDTSIGECVPFEPGDSGGAAEEDGGCACRAAGHEGSNETAGLGAIALLGLAAGLRRVRRRAR